MLDALKFWKKKVAAPDFQAFRNMPEAYGYQPAYNNVFSVSYDGEKNVGEIGPIKQYILDYEAMRYRSWQAYLDSEIAQIIINRNITWVIGAGLKLQCEPQREVLKGEGFDIDLESYNRAAEARFKVYAESSISSFNNMGSLHTNAEDCFRDSIVGGDTLVVLRLIDNEVKVEVIDGAHIATPVTARFQGAGYVWENGNRILNGVEVSATGEHVAYHIRTASLSWKRIPARGERTGLLMAYLVKGLKYRLNNIRGIPLIIAVMETAKKLDRYKEATVGSAEERQKIPYFIEHGVTSTGENPLIKQMAKAYNADKPGDIPVDADGNKLADRVAATTNKMVFNMPQDSKIVALDSRNELSFGDFYTKNADLICATVEIPPNVAMSKYDSNYSASRAAVKDWEHTLMVKRKRFSKQFYQPVYNLWLHTQIHRNKIHAPGYLTATMQRNQMALEAYTSARWVGANVPHIDPVKEVNAERLKLGELAANVPLTTIEQATETLNGGEASSNMEQFAGELKFAGKLGLKGNVTKVQKEDNEEEESD